MSQIFTPEAVRRHHVPNVGEFEPLAKAYQNWLPQQFWFLGGMLSGSVLQGTQNRRSDIDLFVMFREGMGQTTTQALARFRKQRARHIPVNISLWSERELQSGNHIIGEGFRAHLAWAAKNGGLIGEDPTPHITLKPRHRGTEDLKIYVTLKVAELREFQCENGHWTEQRCRVLEDVGMASIHATRRWLSLCGHTDDEFRRKEDAVALLGRHCPASGEKLSTLLAADTAYEEALDASLESYNRDMYLDALNKLSQHVGDAIVFLMSLI